MLSITLPSLLSSTLPNALDGTRPASSTIRIHVSSQTAHTYTPNMLPSTPPTMFSCILPDMFSGMLQIALDGTLPACLTVCSQVWSQDACKYTMKILPSTPRSTFSSTLLSMLCRTLLIVLDGALLACLTVRSQAHSQSHLTICSHVWSWVLDL
jgi:hypothetical protein